MQSDWGWVTVWSKKAGKGEVTILKNKATGSKNIMTTDRYGRTDWPFKLSSGRIVYDHPEWQTAASRQAVTQAFAILEKERFG